MDYYVLDKDGNPVPATLEEWSAFLETNSRVIKQENVGKFWVSTVFIGLDSNIFETMIFATTKANEVVYEARTRTIDRAVEVHEFCVKKALAMLSSEAASSPTST